MNQLELEKFRRNSGVATKVKIGEDDFLFLPLPLRKFPDLMWLGKKISDDDKAIFEKENMLQVVELVDYFVKNSYPDIPDDDRESFVRDNLFALLNAMQEVSASMTSKLTDDQKRKIEEMRKAQEKEKVE